MGQAAILRLAGQASDRSGQTAQAGDPTLRYSTTPENAGLESKTVPIRVQPELPTTCNVKLREGTLQKDFVCKVFILLKVFTNEKRGGLGLGVISFDRPPFKLLSRKFSKESVQAPSCERHKTTQRTPVFIIGKQLLIPNNAILSGCDTFFTS